MAHGRLWVTLALAPILCGVVITACSSSTNYPPLPGAYEAGAGGGGQHGGEGGGGGSSNNACFNVGGICTAVGNICPLGHPGVSCGPGSVLICCSGYDDAGAPDVVLDTGPQ
jgi:hypothetical protein